VGMVGVPMRQEIARAAIAERLARSKHLLGALLVGSLAAGVADAASDIDLLVCARPGRFGQAWQDRHELHVTGALARWDDGPEPGREIAVHRWVTGDMVLVEALFTAPDNGVRLAQPWRLIAGGPDVVSSFAPRPPIERAEFSRAGAHPIDLAFDDLKKAVRTAGG
jgi:predicted nucleotidyltransferase